MALDEFGDYVLLTNFRYTLRVLLLVSDVPLTPEGVKTEESEVKVTKRWSDIHL